MHSLRVFFVFRGKNGRAMGGAETSMLRMMKKAHPRSMDCHVLFYLKPLLTFKSELDHSGIPNSTVKTIKEYYWAIKKTKPDIVYLFARIPYLPLWGLVAKLAGAKCVIGAERGSAATIIDWISIQISHFFLDGFIANSISAQKHILKAGVRSEKVRVVYNGIEVEPCAAQEDLYSVQFGHPSVLCVANIHKQKGHKVLLEAIVILRMKYPQARAVLIGNDYTDGEFFAEMAAEGLSGTFTWIGGVRNIQDYMRRANLFVLPSLWGEGTPTVILEAMSMGLPVIASNTGGIPELIGQGETGLLVNPGCPDEISAAIERLISNPDLANSLVIKAKNIISKGFTVQSMVDMHLHTFNHFLNLT